MPAKLNTLISIGLFLLVVGCKKSDSLVDNSSSGTIQGILTDDYGIPLQGYHITVLGKTTTTSLDGSFAINEITTPYDLIVTPGVYLFKNLSNRNLTVKLHNVTQGYSHNRIMKVKVDTMDAGIVVCFENGIRYWKGGLIDGSGLFSIDVDWAGSSPITGTVHVLKNIGIPPSSYIGYASRSVSLIDTTTVYFVKSDFSDPIEYPLNVSLSLGSMPEPEFSLFLFKGDVPIIPLWDGSIFTSPIHLYVPSIQNLNVGFFAINHGLGNSYSFFTKNGISSSTPFASVTWGTIPSLVSPSSQTNGVSLSTVFNWSNFDKSGMYLFTATPDTNSSSIAYYIWTEETSTSLPDLSSLGISFPRNMPYYWSVYNYFQVRSTDELTSSAILSPVVNGNYSWSQENRVRTAQ